MSEGRAGGREASRRPRSVCVCVCVSVPVARRDCIDPRDSVEKGVSNLCLFSGDFLSLVNDLHAVEREHDEDVEDSDEVARLAPVRLRPIGGGMGQRGSGGPRGPGGGEAEEQEGRRREEGGGGRKAE